MQARTSLTTKSQPVPYLGYINVREESDQSVLHLKVTETGPRSASIGTVPQKGETEKKRNASA